jgi:hypothetical protein
MVVVPVPGSLLDWIWIWIWTPKTQYYRNPIRIHFSKSSPVRPITYVELYQSSVNWTGFVEMDSNWIPIILRLTPCLFINRNQGVEDLS